MNDLDRIKEQNRQIDEQNYEIVARLSRIEEQNCQIIAMIQGRWTWGCGYLHNKTSNTYGQLPQNWQGEKP